MLQLPTQQDQPLLLTAKSIKQQLQSLTHVPIELQRLSLNKKFLHDESPISPSISLSTIQLNLSLLEGKGGFCSVCGAEMKAGQKKTNFDVCCNKSGRRLRHVNVKAVGYEQCLCSMKDNQQKCLNYIEETVLKKRKSSEEWAIRRREQLQERKCKIKEDKKLTFKRAEQYIKEFRSRELDLIRMKHRAKRQRTAFISPASELLFIIRIRGKNGVHPKTQKILNSLGLKRIFNGVFLKATEGTLAMLQIVEPYVTYGYPNLKNVRELIYKKGHANMDKQRVPLTDNNIIEQALGKYGILCIEDIVYQIANVGPHFKEVVTFLWPLTLNKPEGGLLQGKMNLFKNGGDSGNRGDQINELIAKMN